MRIEPNTPSKIPIPTCKQNEFNVPKLSAIFEDQYNVWESPKTRSRMLKICLGEKRSPCNKSHDT